MPPKNFNNRKNLNIPNKNSNPCMINAQRWYMVKSINGVKTEKNPVLFSQYYTVANYYLNGNAYVIKN
jgi:hypothetical protein